MERGEALVDNASTPFSIWSKSPLIFLSNPIGDPKSQYGFLLEKLCRNPTMGRRFGIILYKKDAKTIKAREKDLKGELAEKIALFRAIEEYAFHQIKEIIFSDKVWKWLNERNEEWAGQALSLLENLPQENEELALFFKEFILNGGTHTRGGALNCAIVDNLDKIALKEYDVDDILRDAEEYLAEILRINFNSIQQITQNFREGLEDLVKRTFDTLPTYLKEIVSAIELWRRSLKEEEKEKIVLPYKLYLEQIPYKPSLWEYFSEPLKIAKRGNPSKHNDLLKRYFNLEVQKDNDDLTAIIWKLEPVQAIKPTGTFLDILDKKDNLTKIRDKGDGSNLQEQGHGIDQKLDLSKILGQHEIVNLDMDKTGVQNGVQNAQGDKAKGTKDEPAPEQDTIPKPCQNVQNVQNVQEPKQDSIPKQFENSENSEISEKLYRCKTCKCGPWKTLEMAKEHARLMPGHEIEEVGG
jgi:hypothetical protein